MSCCKIEVCRQAELSGFFSIHVRKMSCIDRSRLVYLFFVIVFDLNSKTKRKKTVRSINNQINRSRPTRSRRKKRQARKKRRGLSVGREEMAQRPALFPRQKRASRAASQAAGRAASQATARRPRPPSQPRPQPKRAVPPLGPTGCETSRSTSLLMRPTTS